MTQRLYQADSYLREFEANVLSIRPHGKELAAVLDRTAFYPTSGGQPHDTGMLNNAAVVDVSEEDDTILHIVTDPVAGRVVGRIDWPRRLDHMQQHTGQHILSQAFLQTLSAQTLAVHFGADVSTLDLGIADLAAPAVEKAEDLANTVVFEDRAVIVGEVDEAELPDLGLRRPAKKRGRIRVVEVEGFDRSACGGTHVRRTAEVGPIKIQRWERYKGGTRVEFLCGWRALRDYRWKHGLVRDLAAAFSVKDSEVGETVQRLASQLRDRERTLAELRERLLDIEAHQRLASVSGSPKVIAEVVTGWPADAVAALAGKLVSMEPAVAALGTVDGKLVMARSPNVSTDAAALMRYIVGSRGGRGGGRPEFAQGAVPPALVGEAIEAARREITRLLTSRPSTQSPQSTPSDEEDGED